MGEPLADLARWMYQPDRLYPLGSEPSYGWWAGHLPDGRQALVLTLDEDELSVLTFDAGGRYLGVEQRVARLAEPPGPDDGLLKEAELQQYLRAALGLTPGQIRVRRFAEPSLLVSIEPLVGPDDLPDVAGGDLADLTRMVADGDFEFHSGNVYVVDCTGEVVSS